MTTGWCKHYSGMFRREACEAGVKFAEVADPAAPRQMLERYPCFPGATAPERCPHRQMPTPEDLAEADRQAAEAFKAYMSKLKADVCPFCDQSITKRVQVGRCVYAEPCNHRLYQGRLTAAERGDTTPQQQQKGLWGQ